MDKPVKVCPECGIPLDGLDIPAHALTHWVEYLDPAISGKKARERQKKLLGGGVTLDEYVKEHSEV